MVSRRGIVRINLIELVGVFLFNSLRGSLLGGGNVIFIDVQVEVLFRPVSQP
jgi:hypothetical protein